MFSTNIGNTKRNTNQNTVSRSLSSSGKGSNKDSYLQIRMNREWKEQVRLISEEKGISLSKFIRSCVDQNIQSL